MIFENNDNNWNGSKEAIRNCNFAQISLFFFANFKSPDRMSCTLDFMHFFFRVRRMSRKNYYIGGPIMTNIIFLAAALHNFKHDMS